MNKSRIILPSTAEGDRRSSEGRVDLVINHNDDKENDDKENDDKKDNNISIIHK